MTMKQLLHCTLIFLVLVTSGCGFWGDESTSRSNTNSSPSPRTESNKIDFAGAADDVEQAISKLNSPGRPGQLATVKPVKNEINKAIEKLAEKEINRCTDCTQETKDGAADALRNLTGILTKLGTDSTTIAELGEDDVKAEVQRELGAAASKLTALSTAKPRATESRPLASPSASSSEVGITDQNTTDAGWWSTLVLALKIASVLVALILLASALSYLWKRAWKTFEFSMGHVVARHLAATREAQPDYTSKLSSLSSAQAEISSTLTELNTEVRSLARLVRESITIRRSDGHPSYSGFNYQSHTENALPKDEPEFPVSAFDYLGKMNRFANVVRPDFQNGILVNAPDGDGELVLIRDSRDETQPLFVVPRATQFQTKQDFYTYYQKYYECDRPSAGDVWIIGPAVVEKVTGGWQLREKGMLEVR